MDTTKVTDLDTFTDSLISQRGFSVTDPAVQKEIKQDVAKRLDNFLIDRMVDAFSEEDALSFNELLREEKSREDLLHFAQTHIKDFDEFLMNTLLDFEEIYLHQ